MRGSEFLSLPDWAALLAEEPAKAQQPTCLYMNVMRVSAHQAAGLVRTRRPPRRRPAAATRYSPDRSRSFVSVATPRGSGRSCRTGGGGTARAPRRRWCRRGGGRRWAGRRGSSRRWCWAGTSTCPGTTTAPTTSLSWGTRSLCVGGGCAQHGRVGRRRLHLQPAAAQHPVQPPQHRLTTTHLASISPGSSAAASLAEEME